MRLFTILILLLPILVKAQPCSNNPGMSPATAIPVCGTSSFTQNVVANCIGTQNIPNSSVCGTQVVTSDDSFWYRFHCFQTGTLGFLITPMSASDDYDWEVFNLAGHAPNDVYSLESMRVSLNLSGQTGTTGCISTGIGDVHCGGGSSPTQYNQMPVITAGSDYLLMVTNWSNSGLGYRLNFNGGTAILTDPVPPVINSASANCGGTNIKILFSKDIRCSSVTAAGSEFTIMPGNIPATSITSKCAAGFNSITELTVNVQNPLAPGNYNLVIKNGTDGNTFNDVCDNQVAVGTPIPFSITAMLPGAISNIGFSGCAPTVLDIKLSNPVLCNTITASGTEFAISPGNPAIISVQSADCNIGGTSTDLLHIVLQNPLPHGNYQLILRNGIDGNTLIDTCSTPMQPASIPFVINQTTPPVIQSIDFNECHPDQVVLNFDKPISCNSISVAGSEFSINPGNIPVAAVQSTCAAGGYTSQLVLLLANPLPAGNFTVNINNGTDVSTIADTCFSFITAGYVKPFVTTQAPIPIFDSVVKDICNPAFVKAYYSKAIKCSSISADGSDYFITGPSAVNITAATMDATCSGGYTNWVLLQFAQPVNISGTYVLHNRAGNDGNGVIDTCSAVQNTAETISFAASAKPSPVFNNQVLWGCVNDTIVLSHPGGNGVNSWIWKFSDGTTATGQNATHVFPVSTVTATVKLIVANSQCTDSIAVDITLNNGFNSAFSSNPADTTCIGTAVTYTNNSTGSNLNYLWDFGDNSSFNGSNPPAHNYSASNRYTVQLVATDNQGCRDTTIHTIAVTALPVIDFGVLAPQYCTEKNILLTASLQGNISSYTWDNGDGKSFTNQQQVNFSYSSENNYTIKLAATDRFCGQVEKTKTTQIYLVPVVKLGNDTTFCPGFSTVIGLPNNNAYSYLWNSGASTSQVTTGQLTNNYILTVYNNGCRGLDAIFVKVLSTCLIKIPNAFTPNNDGLNDYLKAVNADLAGKFSLSVYNRFGQKVFATNDPLEGWDGNFKGGAADTGTYVWQVSYIDPVSGKPVYEKGTSILIR